MSRVDKSLIGKVIRIISKDYAKLHHYYDQKNGRAYCNKKHRQDAKVSLTKRILGSDLKVLNITSNNGVLVTYNRGFEHNFYIKLEDWGIDYIYSPETDPEYYI